MTDFDTDETDEKSGSVEIDPRQIILPPIDTSFEWFFGMTAGELLSLVPSVVAGVGGLYAFIVGAQTVGMVLFVVAIVGAVASKVSRVSATWYASPVERMYDFVGYVRLRSKLPLGYSESLRFLAHGVRRFDGGAQGYAVGTDGRLRTLVLARAETNTEGIEREAVQRLASGFTEGIETNLSEMDWSLYSRSVSASSDEVADHYAGEADNPFSRLGDVSRMVLDETARWVRSEDGRWNAREWTHAVEVSVPATTEAGESGWPLIGGTPDDDADTRSAEELLDEAARAAEKSLRRVDGVDVSRAGVHEMAQLCADRWAGDRGTREIPEDMAGAFEDKAGWSDFTPTQRMLAPGHFDVRKSTVEVGEEYARTFWIAHYPHSPDAGYLDSIYSLGGEDIPTSAQFEVRVCATPKSREVSKDELGTEVAEIKGDLSEKAKDMDVRAYLGRTKEGAYITAYQLVGTNYNVSTWGISTYVTVRADSQTELEQACDEVKDRLHAANIEPVASGRRQYDQFVSGGPLAPDRYEDKTLGGKASFALSGAFGAILPFSRPNIFEPDGMLWGRTNDGRLTVADIFQRGIAPHGLTVGASRSGKTYSTLFTFGLWLLAGWGENRRLIFFDTQMGGEGLCELFNGEHIMLGGDSSINPHHIRDSAGAGQSSTARFSQRVSEVSQFYAAILRAQGIDPASYMSIIQQAVQVTYSRFGITADPRTHDEEMPTPKDFLETLERMSESPDEYTLTGSKGERELKEQELSRLLSKLTAFAENGMFEEMLDSKGEGIPSDARFVYMDAREFNGSDDVEMSIMQSLAFSQVSQFIKETDDECVAIFDEAHNLLHSEEMSDWLQKAAREWARYNASLQFVTQSPQEFVRQARGATDAEENDRESILEQCSRVSVFALPKTDVDLLADLGLGTANLIKKVKEKLVPGRAGAGYSTCLIDWRDQRGWREHRVEVPQLFDYILTYRRDRDGDFYAYLRRRMNEPDDEGEEVGVDEEMTVDNYLHQLTNGEGSETVQEHEQKSDA